MGACLSCEKLRTFHSRQNWLGKGNIYRIQRPYSDISTGFACVLPITCFIVFISWMAYILTDPGREDSQHIVYMKDAKPHWRLSEKQYRHFYQPLQFAFPEYDSQFSSSPPANFTATVHQTYEANIDERSWECTDYIAQKTVNATLSADDGYKNNQATLCYYDRHSSFANPYGLFLCRNTNTETVYPRIQVPKYDRQTGEFSNDEYLDVIVQQWDPNESIIITLQLWVLYDWSDQQGNPWATEPDWRQNEVQIVSVEQYPNQQFRPQTADDWCYGIKVMMSRQVYVVEDGTGGWNEVIVALSLFGGAWSFILLFHAGCGACWDTVVWYCSKKRWQKDMEFAVRFQAMEDERYSAYKTGAVASNASLTRANNVDGKSDEDTQQVQMTEQEQGQEE